MATARSKTESSFWAAWALIQRPSTQTKRDCTERKASTAAASFWAVVTTRLSVRTPELAVRAAVAAALPTIPWPSRL